MPRWARKWLATAAPAKRELWRGVEAQHRVATMRLVDDLQEQALLEQLLEDSKPTLPAEAKGSHYLLFTPFRYAPDWPSRECLRASSMTNSSRKRSSQQHAVQSSSSGRLPRLNIDDGND